MHSKALNVAVRPMPYVRYIKLGRAGGWEKECIDKGIIRLGFNTGKPERFRLCTARNWNELTTAFLNEDDRSKGTANRFTNEIRHFFEDNGYTIWITFSGDRLFWGKVTPQDPEPHPDGHGVFRYLNGGWKDTDAHGELLTRDRLSSALTKLSSYRGTSCNVDVGDYVIRRIKGKKTTEVEKAIAAQSAIKAAVKELVPLLDDTDFEILADLIFSSSGWRRLGPVGGHQKTSDFEIMLPSTGERAIVQVKSKTMATELKEYIKKFETFESFERLFYVFHTGKIEIDDDRVIIIGLEKLSELIVDMGFTNWLIDKVHKS